MANSYIFLWVLLSWMVSLGSMVSSEAGVVSGNNNTHPVGRLEENVLILRLYAGVGSWRPEGPQGATIEIAAFGEEGDDLSIPGPLIRVREGTTVVLTLRNGLGSPLWGPWPVHATKLLRSRVGSRWCFSRDPIQPKRSRHLLLLGRDPIRTDERPAPWRQSAWRRDRRRSARGIAGPQSVCDLDLRRATRAGFPWREV